MNITNDILLYKVSEYLGGQNMFKLGQSSASYNQLYSEYEVFERSKCINNMNLKYIYDRDNLTLQERNEIMNMMSLATGKTIKFLKNKLINLIISKKDGKKMQYNYTYLYEYFCPVKHSKWLYKYATTELLSSIYFLDIVGYQGFVEKSRNYFKLGKKKTDERINWFIDEIDLNNYVIGNNTVNWWMTAFEHCLMRTDSHTLVKKLENKMHLFDLTKMLYDDVLEIASVVFTYEPTIERIKYLSYLKFDKKLLLFAIEETNANIDLHSDEGYKSWLSYIIEYKEYFGFEDEDFYRESLEDMLLSYDFVDSVIEHYRLVTFPNAFFSEDF